MFSDYTTQVITFPSISHKKRATASTDTQTSNLGSQDESLQTHCLQSQEVQTEDKPKNYSADNNASCDENALNAFLKRVVPLLQEELDVKLDFSELEDANESSELAAVKTANFKRPFSQNMKVSCMSWNCTGGTLAVGFTAQRHDSWCSHEGHFAVYATNLTRQEAPRIMHHTSCVSSLAFHPWEPSILAVGLYQGDVFVWDLRKHEDWIAKETNVEHASQVVHVGWYQSHSETTCFSAGADGQILLRKIALHNCTITVAQRFMITQGHAKMNNPDKGLEITALAGMAGGSGVAAAGAGGLLHIDLTSLSPLPAHPDCSDPVIFKYESHRSVITAVRLQPHSHRFASVSCDGEIRIYTMLQVEPKYIIHMKTTTFDAYWSPNQTIIGASGFISKVIFLRIATGQALDFSVETSGKALSTVMEPNTKRGTVAVGDSEGNVEIWRVTSSKHSG